MRLFPEIYKYEYVTTTTPNPTEEWAGTRNYNRNFKSF